MGEHLLRLAQVAETWHCRPSELLAVEPPLVAVQLDFAAAVALWRWREEQMRRGGL